MASQYTPGYGWNPIAGRYVNLLTGRFVPFSAVRDALELTIQASQAQMQLLTLSLQSNTISLAQWELAMMEQIRITNVASAVAARGGWAQMSQADWGFVGQQIRTQYDYLRNFSYQIYTGQQRLDGTLLWRANMYANAGRGRFEEMRRRCERLYNNMNEERRVLGQADHCPGCLDQASRSWQPIMTLDPIGAEECRTNCRCNFEFRNTRLGAVPVLIPNVT